MTDEITGKTEMNDEIGAKEHVAPTPNTPTSSRDVLKNTPSPVSFATKNDITLRDDIAKILSDIKLPERPERKDAYSTEGALSQKMPRSSAPIRVEPSATTKIETPIKNLQEAARATLSPELRGMPKNVTVISGDAETTQLGTIPVARIQKESLVQTPQTPAAIFGTSTLPTPSEISPDTDPQKKEIPVRGSSMRTLKDDLRELVRTRKMSLVKAVALESEKKLRINESSGAEEIAATRSRRRRVKRFIITMIICVGLGMVALFTVAYVQTQRTTPRATSYGSSFMFSEQTLTFPLGSLTAHELKQQLSHTRTQVNLTLGAIARIVPTIKEEGPAAGEIHERPARAREFFEILAPSAPEDLLRSFENEFFFGVHAIDENSPLFVMPINSYQNAFASMLAWESVINENLSPLFTRVFHQTIDESNAPRLARFEDVIIRNYDVRALKDTRGEIQMLYAFPTRSVLIIAESPHSFVEALARLRAERRI